MVCSTCASYMSTMGLLPQPHPEPAEVGVMTQVMPVIDELMLAASEATDRD